MTTNYRALCAELLDGIELDVAHVEDPDRFQALLARVRAELAKPEPEGPTDGELEAWRQIAVAKFHDSDYSIPASRTIAQQAIKWCRNQSLVSPVLVSERLPGPEDWDAEGRCWVFDQGDAVTAPAWNLESSESLADLRRMESEGKLIGICKRWRLAWLPANDLPLPIAAATVP
jgi:hypothetical protein